MEGTVLKVKKHTLLVVSGENNFFSIKKPGQFFSTGYKVTFKESDILEGLYETFIWNFWNLFRFFCKLFYSFIGLFKKREADLELTIDGFTSLKLGLTKRGSVVYVQPLNESAKSYVKEMNKWKNHSFEDALETLANSAKTSGVNIDEEDYALTFSSANNAHYFLEKKIIHLIKIKYEAHNLCISIFKTESANYSTNVSFVRYSIANSLGKNLNDGFITEKSLKELKKELGAIENLPGYIGEVI